MQTARARPPWERITTGRFNTPGFKLKNLPNASRRPDVSMAVTVPSLIISIKNSWQGAKEELRIVISLIPLACTRSITSFIT